MFAALGEPTWLGEDHGRAAAFDMSLLDLFWTSVSGFLHALMVAKANGIAPSELLPHARGIVDILPPIFDEFAERIEANRHDESSAPVSSVAASVRHLIAASQEAGVDSGVLEVFRGYVDARGRRRPRWRGSQQGGGRNDAALVPRLGRCGLQRRRAACALAVYHRDDEPDADRLTPSPFLRLEAVTAQAHRHGPHRT